MKKKSKNGNKKFWRLGIEECNTGIFDIANDGDLIVREGHYQYDIAEIARKHGTPTEIFFPTVIENRVRDLVETFTAYIKVLGQGKYGAL
jgi:arginine decarboxylase-like protein